MPWVQHSDHGTAGTCGTGPAHGGVGVEVLEMMEGTIRGDEWLVYVVNG